MTIQLTERAAGQIRRGLDKRGKGVALRVGIKKVGCSGLAYTYDYADAVANNDHLFEAHEARLVVDAEALKVLDGATLDYVKEGFKEVFKFDNPNAKSQCGCGESFNV
ncbi:MAG: iron-sulfur cluster assembly accessory protein [Betaproteobacteria bacterium]|nr:iron-sulfur cluster assembly accessory protein [Betaproteobacteria bacterium]